jgi:phospholipase C
MRDAISKVLATGTLLLAGGGGLLVYHVRADHDVQAGPDSGIAKIKHVVIIMQENRSFDSYFGTYSGADGFTSKNGVPAICVPDPIAGRCVMPYYDNQDQNNGGPHTQVDSMEDIAGGRMNGFVAQAEQATETTCVVNKGSDCAVKSQVMDVMGYHDARDIPTYWAYAENFVLQDHMFASSASWSLPEHLYMVSAWSAYCLKPGQTMSCTNALDAPENPPDFGSSPTNKAPDYDWTDLTYLLHQHNVSWAYYVQSGTQPDCANGAMTCPPVNQNATTPGIWNPLPYFDTVKQDGQLGNIQDLSSFFTSARQGNLPSVSWISPSNEDSEHPPSLVSAGQSYVTGLINAIMQSPDWSSTAIFLSWDDWGGFYDNIPPPTVDQNCYGLRVPGLVISPYARKGYVDHQILSHDAYIKFIEDDFLGGQRLDPSTDGRPDPRPDVRENASLLGNLLSDFDFTQSPRPPLLLPVNPKTNLVAPTATTSSQAP